MNQSRQFSTFFVAERWYGIEVTDVQEIAKPLPITPVHLAPPFVLGLINLRGQIATGISLSELFGLGSDGGEKMTVVCRYADSLLSFAVDQIGDVVEVDEGAFEEVPATVDGDIRRFLRGVYKMPDAILSVIETEKINLFLNK